MKILKPRQKRVLKKAVKRLNESVSDQLSLYQESLEILRSNERDGKVGIFWTSVDCDMCKASGTAVVPATLTHVKQWVVELFDGAEGPTSWFLTTPEEERASFRDLALEAHENGHPHCVTI